MYTRRVGNGDIPSRGCTRGRHVKYADEDLQFLNGQREFAERYCALHALIVSAVYADDGVSVPASSPMRASTVSINCCG